MWRSQRTQQRMQQNRERRAQRRAMRAATAIDAIHGQAGAAIAVSPPNRVHAVSVELPIIAHGGAQAVAASAPPSEPPSLALAMPPAVNPNSHSPSSSSSGSSTPHSHSNSNSRSGSVALSSIGVNNGFSSNCVICLGDFPTISSLPQSPVHAASGSRFFLPCAHSFHERLKTCSQRQRIGRAHNQLLARVSCSTASFTLANGPMFAHPDPCCLVRCLSLSACIDQWFEACEERSQALCCPTCRQIVEYV